MRSNGRPSHHTEAFGNPDETRLVKVVDAANKSWNYTYNALGRLRLVTAPDDTTRTFEYYPDTSWLLSETHPESGTTTYTYDSVGTLLTRTNAENQTTTYTYDANYRLKTIAAAGESLAISYRTGLDDRAQVTSGSHVINFRYDGAGRLAKAETVTDGRRRELSYSWDANDNLQTLMYPSLRRIQFTYDSGNRIESIRDVLSGTPYGAAFDYHPSGAVSSYTAGNGIPFTFDYDPDRYWPTLIASGPLGLTYGQYDAVGNVGVISDSRGASWNQTFTYDDLDRLASATGAYGARAYAYDDHGNMLGDGAATFTYNSSTLRLATRNGQALSYNNNGSVTGGINGTFTYTGRNQLASATVGGQAAASSPPFAL
jgi:YD repeat-containing protein